MIRKAMTPSACPFAEAAFGAVGLETILCLGTVTFSQ